MPCTSAPARQVVTIDVALLAKEFRAQCCEKRKGFETRAVLRGLQEFNALATVLGSHLLPVARELAGALVEAVRVWKTRAVLEEVWRCAAAVCSAAGLAVGPHLLPPFVEVLLEMEEWHGGCLKALARMLHASGTTLATTLRQRLEHAVLQRFLTQHSTRDTSPLAAARLCQSLRVALACATVAPQSQRPPFLALLTKVLLLADAFPHPKVRATAAAGLLQVAALLHPQSPAVALPTAEAVAELYGIGTAASRKPAAVVPVVEKPIQQEPPPQAPVLAKEIASTSPEAECPGVHAAPGTGGPPVGPPLGRADTEVSTAAVPEPEQQQEVAEEAMSIDGPEKVPTEAVMPRPGPPLPPLPVPAMPETPVVISAASAADGAKSNSAASGDTGGSTLPDAAVAKCEQLHTVVGPSVPNYVAMDVDDEESEDDNNPEVTVAVPEIVTSESEDDDEDDGMDD